MKDMAWLHTSPRGGFSAQQHRCGKGRSSDKEFIAISLNARGSIYEVQTQGQFRRPDSLLGYMPEHALAEKAAPVGHW